MGGGSISFQSLFFILGAIGAFVLLAALFVGIVLITKKK